MYGGDFTTSIFLKKINFADCSFEYTYLHQNKLRLVNNDLLMNATYINKDKETFQKQTILRGLMNKTQ